MIRVVLPAPLCRLARIDGPVELAVDGLVTQGTVLDALEEKYPMLLGTTRDRYTRKRRAYIRFFACGEDWSDASPDDELPDAVASGKEPFLVVGALAGG